MKVQVYIGTSEGPVRIERITREGAPTRQSAICLRRTTETLAVSTGYNAFVKSPSGVIEREFGPFEDGAFRLDVSANHIQGNSWQLAVFAAHALAAQGRLAGVEEDADIAVWATGEVSNDLAVTPVTLVPDKLRASVGEIEALIANGVSVKIVVPAVNDETQFLDLPEGVELIAVATTDALCDPLGLSPPRPTTGTDSRAAAGADRRSRWPVVAGLAAVCLAAGVYGVYRWQPSLSGLAPAGMQPAQLQSTQLEPTQSQPSPATGGGESEHAKDTAPPAAEKVAPLDKTMPPVEKVAALPPVSLEIHERRAKAGTSCAAVHFGTAQPITAPVRISSGATASSRWDDSLCGLRFVVNAGKTLVFAALVLRVRKGRYAEVRSQPKALDGATAFSGKLVWRINLPMGRRGRFEYDIAILADRAAVADAAKRLAARADWDRAVEDLKGRLLGASTVRHTMAP